MKGSLPTRLRSDPPVRFRTHLLRLKRNASLLICETLGVSIQ
jgi:hypothetical protein